MDLIALIVAIVAVLVFAFGDRYLDRYLAIGLALLTSAWIINSVHLTGYVVSNR